jgi:hypothetical protein
VPVTRGPSVEELLQTIIKVLDAQVSAEQQEKQGIKQEIKALRKFIEEKNK